MNTYQHPQKFQITLTPQEIQAFALKGQSLGYDVVKYIKYLISREAFSIVDNIPVYTMSEQLEKETLEAIDAAEKGKLDVFCEI